MLHSKRILVVALLLGSTGSFADSRSHACRVGATVISSLRLQLSAPGAASFESNAPVQKSARVRGGTLHISTVRVAVSAHGATWGIAWQASAANDSTLRYAPTADANWRSERSGVALTVSKSSPERTPVSSVDLAVFQRDGEPVPGPQYAVVTVMADEVHPSPSAAVVHQGSL